jgi:hypothetical protein
VELRGRARSTIKAYVSVFLALWQRMFDAFPVRPAEHRPRHLSSASFVLAIVTLLLGISPVVPADATTGNGEGLPVPRVLVNPIVGHDYVGTFLLDAVQRGSGIAGGRLDVEYTRYRQTPFLAGSAQFEQYVSNGSLTSWVATTYPWVYRRSRMLSDLTVPGAPNHVIGRLTFTRIVHPDTAAKQSGEQIEGTLRVGGSTYAVRFRQLGDDVVPPSRLPNLKVLPPVGGRRGLPVHVPEAPGPAMATNATNAGVYASVVLLVRSIVSP